MSKHGHANLAIFVPHLGCPNQCSFCNQRVISGVQQSPTPQQVSEICEESLCQMGERAKEAEIAFFGGSFTAIPHEQMTALLQAAQPYLWDGRSSKPGFGGIRCSTRPDAVDEQTLLLLREYGVKVIELGAQSMDNTVLQKNLRGHTAEDVEQASRRIQRMGFSLGLQMMTGLYGQSEESALDTARQFIGLRPDMVRIYPTVVLKGTLLAQLWQSGRYQPQTPEQAAQLGAQLLELFEQHHIPVIRFGLHASREVEAQMLGGGYHPALREMAESVRFLGKMRRLLLEDAPQGGSVQLNVHPRDLSKALGQKKSNIQQLMQQGWQVTVKTDPAVIPGSVCSIRQQQRSGEVAPEIPGDTGL